MKLFRSVFQRRNTIDDTDADTIIDRTDEIRDFSGDAYDGFQIFSNDFSRLKQTGFRKVSCYETTLGVIIRSCVGIKCCNRLSRNALLSKLYQYQHFGVNPIGNRKVWCVIRKYFIKVKQNYFITNLIWQAVISGQHPVELLYQNLPGRASIKIVARVHPLQLLLKQKTRLEFSRNSTLILLIILSELSNLICVKRGEQGAGLIQTRNFSIIQGLVKNSIIRQQTHALNSSTIKRN